jgi:virulence-associated protein VapD
MDKIQDYYKRRSEAEKQVGIYLIVYTRLGFPWKQGSIHVEQFGYNSKDAKMRLERKEHPFAIKVESMTKLKKLSL